MKATVDKIKAYENFLNIFQVVNTVPILGDARS